MAQQLRVAEEEVARLRAVPKKVEQLVTEDVKVGKTPRTCQHANVDIAPHWLQIKWRDQVITLGLPCTCVQPIYSSSLYQDGRTALTVDIHGIGSKSVRT